MRVEYSVWVAAMSSLRYLVMLGVLVAAPIGLCAPVMAAQMQPLTIHTKSGDHVFNVEFATTDAERERGLMNRHSMAADTGMVFDFFREQPVYFWMKNTYVSLDMIFIRANGTVARVASNTTPLSEKVVPSRASVRYVLEVVAGTANRIGLEPGDKITW